MIHEYSQEIDMLACLALCVTFWDAQKPSHRVRSSLETQRLSDCILISVVNSRITFFSLRPLLRAKAARTSLPTIPIPLPISKASKKACLRSEKLLGPRSFHAHMGEKYKSLVRCFCGVARHLPRSGARLLSRGCRGRRLTRASGMMMNCEKSLRTLICC